MTERDSLLQAIAASPEDDTLRLAYASWLEEHERTPEYCTCTGNGTCDPMPWCPECKGDGTVLDTSLGRRAEFIRVQMELMKCRDGVESCPPDSPCGHCKVCELRNRQSELLATHPKWSRLPCPECGGRGRVFDGYAEWDCQTCGTTGDLLAARQSDGSNPRILRPREVPRGPQFARGFIDSVACRLDEVIDADGTLTAWALAIVRELPITRFRVTDKQPWCEADSANNYRWLVNPAMTASDERHAIPKLLWERVSKERYLTREFASDALGLAAARLVRESIKQHDTSGVVG